jgi:iron complex transport system substrate-binding protein
LRSWRLCERRRSVFLFFALAFAPSACTPPPDWGGGEVGEPALAMGVAPVAAVDDAGREVRLPRPAARVVSLLPAVTETLLALGAGETLVARTDYDHDPSVAHLPSVGGGLTPSLEVLAALRPDLVVAWEEAGTARVRPRLEELGISVFALRTQDTTDIFNNIRRLGHLTGRDRSADSVALRVRAGLDSVRASVAGLPEPTVLYVVGIDPPLTAGPNTFISQLIGVAGGRTVFPDLRTDWPQISLEEVVRRRPDVLILPVGADEQASLQRLRTAAGWRDLLAGGHTRVHAVPADLLNRPGTTIVESARLLRAGIHPTP